MKQRQFSFFSREEESFGSCDPCKKSHQKCDRGKPHCDRCMKSKTACVYLPLKRVSNQAKRKSLGSLPQSEFSTNISKTPLPSPSPSPPFPPMTASISSCPTQATETSPESVSLLFASSLEGFSKSLGTSITVPPPKRSGRDKDGKKNGMRGHKGIDFRREGHVDRVEKTAKQGMDFRRERKADGLDHHAKRIKRSTLPEENGGEDSQIFFDHPSSQSEHCSSSHAHSMPLRQSFSAIARPSDQMPCFLSPFPLQSPTQTFSSQTSSPPSFAISPESFVSSASSFVLPRKETPYTSYELSPLKLSSESSASSYQIQMEPVGDEREEALTEQFNRMLISKKLCVCGQWDVQKFHDLGWLRAIPLEEKIKVEMDEQSQQQAVLFDDPDFQRRWVMEQPSPTFFLSDPFVLHMGQLRIRPLRIRRVNASFHAIWAGAVSLTNCFHPTSQKRVMNDIMTHAFSPSMTATTYATFPIAISDSKGHWREFSQHAFHFYDKEGSLKYITRILTPSVTPIRTISTSERDNAASNSQLVHLPSIQSLVPSLPRFPLPPSSHFRMDASSSLISINGSHSGLLPQASSTIGLSSPPTHLSPPTLIARQSSLCQSAQPKASYFSSNCNSLPSIKSGPNPSRLPSASCYYDAQPLPQSAPFSSPFPSQDSLDLHSFPSISKFATQTPSKGRDHSSYF